MPKEDAQAYLGALSKAMGPSAAAPPGESAPDMGGEDVFLDDALACLDKAIGATQDDEIRSKLEQAKGLIEECVEDAGGADEAAGAVPPDLGAPPAEA